MATERISSPHRAYTWPRLHVTCFITGWCCSIKTIFELIDYVCTCNITSDVCCTCFRLVRLVSVSFVFVWDSDSLGNCVSNPQSYEFYLVLTSILRLYTVATHRNRRPSQLQSPFYPYHRVTLLTGRSRGDFELITVLSLSPFYPYHPPSGWIQEYINLWKFVLRDTGPKQP
jgi:hypothetical protein